MKEAAVSMESAPDINCKISWIGGVRLAAEVLLKASFSRERRLDTFLLLAVSFYWDLTFTFVFCRQILYLKYVVYVSASKNIYISSSLPSDLLSIDS